MFTSLQASESRGGTANIYQWLDTSTPPPPSTESKLSKICPPISIPTWKPMQDTCTSSKNNEAYLYIQYHIATTTSRSIQNKKYFKSMCRKYFQKDIVW